VTDSTHPRPVTPDRLSDLLADLMVGAAAGRPHPLRVLLDGAPAAGPGALADALVEPLRVRGRQPIRIAARWFLRPASVRLERGRTDPDAFYDDWLDLGGLRREVLSPLGPGGSGRYLPTLHDPDTDRATRSGYRTAPAGAIVLVDGSLLLGRGLPVDLSVHLRLSPAALARKTPEAERWMLPAFARYDAAVRPSDAADVVVRADDPRHPAVMFRRS
jgi:hypothetical protein